MKRLLKIYWMIIKANFSLLFAYRANLYNSFIITIGWGLVSVFSVILIAAKVSHVYGWSREELYLLTGLFSICVGIFHMLFSSSMEKFGRIISTGGLDSYLLAPIDAQLYLSTKQFRPISILRTIIGVIFTLIVLQQLHASINLFSLFVMSILVLIGVLLLYSLWFFVVTFMMWNPNLTNLIDFLYVANNLGRYPPSMLMYTRNFFLYLAVPVTLIASVPARFILGKVSAGEVIGLLSITAGLFVASRLFWLFALRHYTSASS